VTQINNLAGNAGDVLRQIDDLLRKLEAEASGLPREQADEVVDEATMLHAEVHRRKINGESIRAALARLTSAAGSATTVLATAEQLRDLVTVLLK
jgi:ABC-type transporter Mla subunit MlaD